MKLLIPIFILFAAMVSHASAIKFVNQMTEPSIPIVEFRLFQGSNLVARLGVHAGGSVPVSTTEEYTAVAVTHHGDFTLISNPISFTSASTTLSAQVVQENGYSDFQLVQNQGTSRSAITLENNYQQPVQFKLTRPNTSFQITAVVDERNRMDISTAKIWTVSAVANGITSATVTVMDPDATVTAVNHDGVVTLVVR